LGFPLPVSSCSSLTSAIDMPDPKNVRVAAEILHLASIEAKIHWLCLEFFEILQFPVLRPPFLITGRRWTDQNGIKNTGLGGKLPPHGPY